MRVEQGRAPSRQVAGQAEKRKWVDVRSETKGVDRHAAPAHFAGEVRRTGLPLVQHQHACIPASCA
jgi:hypothetical protein